MGRLTGVDLLLGVLWFRAYDMELLNMAIRMMFWINIFWGLINLLPVYPLDGGQVARDLFSLSQNPHEGITNSLRLSVATGAAAALLGLVVLQSIFIALMFGYLAYTSYRTLQAYAGRGPGVGWR